jgi:hypothetical protein
LDEADDSLLVDDISCPPLVVEFLQGTVIGDQGKTDAMLLDKLPVRFERVGADAQNLGVVLFKVFNVALKSLQLAPSDRGKVGVIEGQDDWPRFQQFRERNFAAG